LVAKVLNTLRLHLRDQHNLVSDNDLAFVWITDFPFYEYDEATDSYGLGHNPFSHVVGGLDALDTDDLGSVQTNQYDMVLNGFEILSGSIRNHDPKVLVRVFEKIGLTENDVKSKFGAMYEAFQYGCPPHGGFAFGFDRLMMILLDEPNIRECYAFPKSGRAEDVMMGAPAQVHKSELKDLHIATIGSAN
jgi:aspartyl-tRNA synthetase